MKTAPGARWTIEACNDSQAIKRPSNLFSHFVGFEIDKYLPRNNRQIWIKWNPQATDGIATWTRACGEVCTSSPIVCAPPFVRWFEAAFKLIGNEINAITGKSIGATTFTLVKNRFPCWLMSERKWGEWWCWWWWCEKSLNHHQRTVRFDPLPTYCSLTNYFQLTPSIDWPERLNLWRKLRSLRGINNLILFFIPAIFHCHST